MPYQNITKARQTSFEAMHCLTIALLNILTITVDKRSDSNYIKEIRLFSALCRWQLETGGRLLLMMSMEKEPEQMYEQHFLKMKAVTERMKQFLGESPREFQAHPITKQAVKMLQEWQGYQSDTLVETVIKSVHPVVASKKRASERPWFNQQLQKRER